MASPSIDKSEGGGAKATLTNWEGHITVDNTAVATLCRSSSTLLQPNYLFAESYSNGNMTAAQNRNNHIQISDSDNDAEVDTSNANPSKRKLVEEGGCRSRGVRRPQSSKRNENPTSGYYSSSNRSVGERRESSSRLGPFSRQTTMGSSLLGDSMAEIVLEDVENESEPTSAILSYCKRKFLRPYLAILALVGINPISTDMSSCWTCLSYLHALIVLLLLLFGYFLQFLCSYRGDRGFVNYHNVTTISTINNDGTVHTIGELLFGYIVPSSLHLLGFLSAVIVCKFLDQEQLQNLVERVFLMSIKPRRLCRVLWIYVVFGFTLLSLLLAYAMPSVLMQTQIIQTKWLMKILFEWQLTTKITFLVTVLVQNLVEIVILSSYCIECYLLRMHLATLSHKLLMHSIGTLDWMREMLEFRKLLNHLNQRVAIPVCFFIVMNLAYAFAGFVYLFNDFDFHYSAVDVVILNITNVLLWLLMGLLPFFLAASVTRICQKVEANGHQIRVRPFVYHNTTNDDLNSTLLFASSLHMSAKLFRMPIQPNYVCFAILIVSIVVITLGMCSNLSAFGNF